jgi:hypothetical protein
MKKIAKITGIFVGKEYLKIYGIENRYLHYAPVHTHTFCKKIKFQYRYWFLQVYTGTSFAGTGRVQPPPLPLSTNLL